MLGREYLLVAIGLASAISFVYLLRRNICIRRVNFSCPLNGVPKEIVDSYLCQNPVMRQAWEQSRYQLGF